MSITVPLTRPLNRPITRAITESGVGSSAFSPLSLFAAGEQGGWYDPSDLTTLFQDTAGTVPVTAAGQSVARINDKSGRGNHLTQTTAGNRPTYQVDGNGKPHLLFDGTDDRLTSTATFNLSSSDKACVFVGAYVAGVTNQTVVNTAATGAGRADIIYLAGASPLPRASLIGSTGPASVRIPAVSAAPYLVVNTAILDIAGATATDEIIVRQNGAVPAQTVTAAGPGGTGNFGNGTLVLGDAATGTTFPLNGRVYGLIVRGGTSTAPQIASTEQFLAGKSGIFF